MTNRREFLQAATALSAVPIVGRAAFAGTRERINLDAVIYDTRYMEAQQFGDRATRLGARVHEITGDITDLWQQELLNHWQKKPAAVMGLTERPALFLLERLAWDHGLRVVFEAEHVLDNSGMSQHRVARTSNSRLLAELSNAGQGWPSVLANNLIEGNKSITGATNPTHSAMAAHLHEPLTLYSWIIAPRSAV